MSVRDIIDIKIQKEKEDDIIYLETEDVKIKLIGNMEINLINTLINNYELSSDTDFIEVVDLAKLISENSKINSCFFEVSSDYLYDLGLVETFKEAIKIKSNMYDVSSDYYDNEYLVYTKNDLVLVRGMNCIKYSKNDNQWKEVETVSIDKDLFNDLKEIGEEIINNFSICNESWDIKHKEMER
ncbi:hypothetical protein [Streptobacillus moniliformis]|uniref:hypothetical protein n=1 Tax=Streptobacillus moniliformis TaxID=34105 RepID=UPI0007E4B012|nr:hypothetical protein [Streptobacillus moniliformis]